MLSISEDRKRKEEEKMKIFLDDTRSCPDRFELCRSYDEFTRLVSANKNDIQELSLDYDLGGFKTGLDACKFLVASNIVCPKITIHSTHSNAYRMADYLKEHMTETEIILLHG